MATTTSKEEFPLIDQLQNELNRVLEETGRLFAASARDSKNPPVAQASRLKQILPSSTNSFHDALDQLEDELQIAQFVLRRDLALCRERDGIPKTVPTEDAAAAKPTVAETEQPKQPDLAYESQEAEDVSMMDAETDAPAHAEESTKPEPPEAMPSAEAPTDDTATTKPPDEPTTKTEPPSIDEKPSEPPLQIDTQNQPKESTTKPTEPAAEDKEPDTGTFSNPADLDSLFGGPTSATIDNAPDFNLDSANDQGDFDFSFGNDDNGNGADNENSLSALLPGLHDYANTQPGGNADQDFSALFGNDIGSAGAGAGWRN
ncbi:uncharacterized protein LTR77_007509 [Saxophila tyrrhenica]|uniref:Mediator of RNA polymerase II transcription subunit 11 n=1 Tax=Saxophila tyrrhenica TaxID=1690608 RepID=A0AAV9P8Y0_9PEZI|nr:hypothetical protein LTR77_007509 [Saxophila tyrrhenica]